MANLQHKPDVRAVTVAIVRNQTEARRIQDKLKAEGIECFLTAERSIDTHKPTYKELGAVKVQVARSDVQHALNILGAKNSARRENSGDEFAWRKVRKPRSRMLARRDPTVPAIVIAFIVIAALVLFLS